MLERGDNYLYIDTLEPIVTMYHTGKILFIYSHKRKKERKKERKCWGVSPTDGLAFMWDLPAMLSSAQARANCHQERM